VISQINYSQALKTHLCIDAVTFISLAQKGFPDSPIPFAGVWIEAPFFGSNAQCQPS
jgi:hypothetical protein